MPAPQRIKELVEKFAKDFNYHQSDEFNEEDVRTQFLNPFFAELGWDMEDKAGKGPYRDVRFEAKLKDKAPDIGFYIDGKIKFYVEAKNPSVDVCNSSEAAAQLRGYGWSAKVPRSIVTDFEELSIYDTTVRPKVDDKARVAKLECIKYTEFVERWDFIASIFSREAVMAGSLDKLVAKHAKQTIDKELLEDISRWRDLLAHNIANRNKVTEERLNRIVQDTINRILFLRICEDRNIAPENTLHDIAEGDGTYAKLYKLFKKAESRYDSDLFEVDTIADLNIDDKPLKEIISELYFPKSPYKFDAIPAEILGQVYEQFLGKVIRLTEGGHAKVEEKPEVRKAGGIYYTPTYIVEYIVQNTVGKLVEGKTPKKIETLSIVDPACGSGSFLLGAYKFLADWYRDWYVADGTEKHLKAKKIYLDADKQWQLTLDERKRILIAHIYGVDLDRQAVEMAKLSLMLEALRAPEQQSLFNERMLPRMADNIKCGNSLVGTDYLGGEKTTDNAEMVAINPFDWEIEFPKIFSQGGFDAIIGNPPYIRIQALKEISENQVAYLNKHYRVAGSGNYDIYVVFVEKGLAVLNKQGRLGYILPNKFFNAQYGQTLRGLISEGKQLSGIVHFGDQQVFVDATTYTALMFLDKQGRESFDFVRVDDLDAWRRGEIQTSGPVKNSNVSSDAWNFSVGETAAIFEKLSGMPFKLADVADRIFQGLITGADSVFLLQNRGKGIYYSEATGKEHVLEAALLHPLCKGSVNIKRYHVAEITKSILFPYKLVDSKAELLSAKEFAAQYPQTWEYLKSNKITLEAREGGKWKHDRWYALGRSQNLSEMEQKKILTPSIASRASFVFDSSDHYYFVGSGGGGGGGYGITLKQGEKISYGYVLSLLNSKLLDAFLKSLSSRFSGDYYAYNKQYIEQLPIRAINFANPSEKESHDTLAHLAETIQANYGRIRAATPESEPILQRQIDAIEHQIDQAVYKLYGLTDNQARIIENGAK